MVPFESDTTGYVKHSSQADKIHCVAFVIDSSTLDVMSNAVLKHIKDLQARMNHRGKKNLHNKYEMNWVLNIYIFYNI